jgi:hypothetical protein
MNTLCLILLRHLATLMVAIALLPSAAAKAGTRDRDEDTDRAFTQLYAAPLAHSSAVPSATPAFQRDWRAALLDCNSRSAGIRLDVPAGPSSDRPASNGVTIDGWTFALVFIDSFRPLLPATPAGPSKEAGSHSTAQPAAP